MLKGDMNNFPVKRKRFKRTREQMDVIALRHSTSKALQQYDEKMKAVDGNHKSLHELWSQAWEVRDTNDIVSYNLRQIQVLIDQQVQQYLALKAENEQRLLAQREAADTVEKLQIYLRDRAICHKEEREQIKLVNELTKSLQGLAKEYRSCILGQKFYMHISNFKKMMIFIKGVLIQEVPNKEVLGKIAEKIEMGTKMITINTDCKVSDA